MRIQRLLLSYLAFSLDEGQKVQRVPFSPASGSATSSQHHFFTSDPHQFAFVPKLFGVLPLPDPPKLPAPSNRPKSGNCKRNYAMIVSYHGPSFPDGFEPIGNSNSSNSQHEININDPDTMATTSTCAATIQGALTAAVGQLVARPSRISSAGRTDALVSGKANVFRFACRQNLDRQQFTNDMQGILSKNSSGSGGMTVQSLQEVHESFHATFSTTSREYIYVLPLGANTVPKSQAMEYADRTQEMLETSLGQEWDYFAVSQGKLRTAHALCTMVEAECHYFDPNDGGHETVPGFQDAWNTFAPPEFPHALVFRFRANRFLKRMIRKSVNALLQEASVPQSVFHKEQWKERLDTKERGRNQAAPPEGLVFWKAHV